MSKKLVYIALFALILVYVDCSYGNQSASYVSQRYSLAYDVYVANGNLKDALYVAQEGLNHEPDSLIWRQRLAEVLLWQGLSEQAFEHWYQLAFKAKSPKALNRAIKLAQGLQYIDKLNELLQLKLTLDPNNPKTITDLVEANDILGKPEFAIEVLNQYVNISKEPELLLRLSELQQQIGQRKEALKNYAKLENYQAYKEKSLYEQAIFFLNDDHLQSALYKLQQLVTLNSTNLEAQRLLADTAWRLQNLKVAKQAYLDLYSHNEIKQSEVNRLVYLLSNKPTFALTVALRLWKKYKSAELLLKIFDLSNQTGNWQAVKYILITADPSTLKEAKAEPSYWKILAAYQYQKNEKTKAFKTIQLAMQKFPNQEDFENDYIWQIVKEPDQYELDKVLEHWYERLQKKPEILQAIAYGFNRLGDREKALAILSTIYAQKKNNPDFLLDYSDLLIQQGMYTSAFLLQQRALKLLINNPSHKDSYLRAYARLSLSFAGGDNYFYTLNHYYRNAELNGQDLLMDWAFKQQNLNLIQYWSQHFYKKTPLPVALYIAERKNNLEKIKTILNMPEAVKIPLNNRVNAAVRVKDYGLARQLIYQGLTDNPYDQSLYQTLVKVMDADANYAKAGVEYRQEANIKGPEIFIGTRHRLSQNLSLKTYVSYWMTEFSVKFLMNVPKHVWNVEPLLIYQALHGYWRFGPTFNHGEKNYAGVLLHHEYTFAHYPLQLGWDLAYNQPAVQTEILQVIGARDYIELHLNYSFNGYDGAHILGTAGQLMDQNRNHLADSYREYVELYHKFFLGYPDYTISVFAEANQFNNKALPDSFIKFVPQGQTPSVNYFVPKNYQQYGVRFYFGEHYRRNYSGQWRPYASLAVLDNTVTKFGYNVDVGAAGKVFGHDHLAIGFTQASSPTLEGAVNRVILLNYKYYFQ